MDRNRINCDFPWSALVKITHDAKEPNDRNLALEFLVRSLDYVVKSQCPVNRDRPDAERYQLLTALNAVRYCLRDPICQERVWNWLADAIPLMDRRMQSAFAVGVLCPILVGPIPWDDDREMFAVNKVMECYLDPQTRWAVLEGFTECAPSQGRDTVHRYNKWREEHHLPPIDVDVRELEEYLMEWGDSEVGNEKGT